jgi:hypothetical protein
MYTIARFAAAGGKNRTPRQPLTGIFTSMSPNPNITHDQSCAHDEAGAGGEPISRGHRTVLGAWVGDGTSPLDMAEYFRAAADWNWNQSARQGVSDAIESECL